MRNLLRQLLLLPFSPAAARSFRTAAPLSVSTGEGFGLQLESMRSILIVRLDRIGDIVLSTAFLRELRRNAAAAKITMVVQPDCADLVETCPYVDEVLTVDMKANPIARYFRAKKFASEKLADRAFDLAVNLCWDVDIFHGAFLSYFSGATYRVGYSENVLPSKQKWNRGCDKLYTHVLDDREVLHAAEQNLGLLKALGGNVSDTSLELWPSDDDKSAAGAILDGFGEETAAIVALCPGAGHPKREWPLGRFKEIVSFLREHHCGVVVIGSPSESHLGSGLAAVADPGVINAVGKLSLRQTAALLERCDLLIGGDTGPAHMAAAAGKPVIVISCHPAGGNSLSANAPERFRPWQTRNSFIQPKEPCSPCIDECKAVEAHCICGIEVQRIGEEIMDILTI